jgi:Gram-negative bacterial TonB protein C-terminal
MVKMLVPAIALLAVVTASAHAAQNLPVSLPKTSKWQLDYSADSCNLVGAFGSDDNQIYVRFTRFTIGDWFKLALFGKRLKPIDFYPQPTIDFGPIVNPHRVQPVNGTAGPLQMIDLGNQRLDDLPSESAKVAVPQITPEQEAATTTLTVGLIGGKYYRFELGAMKATMAALRKCNEDLVRRWGYDPVEQAGLARAATPKGNPGNWMVNSDFPTHLRGENGFVEFRLDVDEAGKTSGCHVLSATKPKGFDTQTCQVLGRRAKFLPALDKSGKPVSSFYVGSVTFQSTN